MKLYLLDASVILCFLLEKNPRLKKQVTSLLKAVARNQAQLFSSPLLPLEVANGLRFILKDPALANQAYRTFLKLPITYLTFTSAQHQKVLSLSYQLNTTVYNTSYHLLAITRKAEFITSDSAYYQKAKSLHHIKLLP